jgi:hypothetical protein
VGASSPQPLLCTPMEPRLLLERSALRQRQAGRTTKPVHPIQMPTVRRGLELDCGTCPSCPHHPGQVLTAPPVRTCRPASGRARWSCQRRSSKARLWLSLASCTTTSTKGQRDPGQGCCCLCRPHGASAATCHSLCLSARHWVGERGPLVTPLGR